MKILHLVSSSTLTGPADPALSIARAQARLFGHDVTFAFDTIRSGNLQVKAGASGVRLAPELGLCTKGGLTLAIRDRARLRALAPSFDVVHAHSSHDHALAVLAGARVVVRSVHHPRSAARRGAQWMAYRKTSAFFVVARAHARLLLESYPSIPEASVYVTPGAVDLERFVPRPDEGRAFRQARGVPADAFVIGMLARFQPGRRQQDLIDAVSIARKNSDRLVHLVFIGKGETQREIEAFVEARGLGALTTFYGFRDEDLPAAIASLDASVLLKEGNDASCRAVLESMAVGVPVIGARYAAIEDALSGTRAGWLVERESVEDLSRALVEALALDPGELARMSTRARARVEEAYGERRRAEIIDAAYRRIPGAPSA